MSNAAIQAGKAVITVGLETKGIDASISQMSRQLKTLGTAFREVGFEVTALAGGITFGLVKALKLLDRPIRISAHIESATISFEVMTGSAQMALNTVKELRAFAASSPLKFEGLAQATETLLAYGVGARRVVKDIKLLGQVSRGDQTRLTRLALAYGQVAAKGKLYASEMRQFTESGFNPLQVLVEKTGKSMGTLLKEMEMGQVRFEDVRQSFIDATSAGGRFFGLLEKQGQSLGGTFTRMVDMIEQAVQPIGDALAGPLKTIMSAVMEAARSLRVFLVENQNLVRAVVAGTLVFTVMAAGLTALGLSILAVGASARILSVALNTVSLFSKVSFKTTSKQMTEVTVASQAMATGIVSAAAEATTAIRALNKSIKGITAGMAAEMRTLEALFVKGFAKASTAVSSFATVLTAQSVKASHSLTVAMGGAFASLQPAIKASMTKAGESYGLGWERIHKQTAVAAAKLLNGLTNVFQGLSTSITASMTAVHNAYVSGWASMLKFTPIGGSLLLSSFQLHLAGLPAAISEVMEVVAVGYMAGWSSLVKQTVTGGSLLDSSFKLQLRGLPSVMTEVMDVTLVSYISGWGDLVKYTPIGGNLLGPSFKLQMRNLPAIVTEAMMVCQASYLTGWEKMAKTSTAGGKILATSFSAAVNQLSKIVSVEMANINVALSTTMAQLGSSLTGIAAATNAAISGMTAELQVYVATLRGVVAEIAGTSAVAAAASSSAKAGTATTGKGKKAAAKKSEEADFMKRLNASIAAAAVTPTPKKRGTPAGAKRGPYKKKVKEESAVGAAEEVAKSVAKKTKPAKTAVATVVATAAATAAAQVAAIVKTSEEVGVKAATASAQKVTAPKVLGIKSRSKQRKETLARVRAESAEFRRRQLLAGGSAQGADSVERLARKSGIRADATFREGASGDLGFDMTRRPTAQGPLSGIDDINALRAENAAERERERQNEEFRRMNDRSGGEVFIRRSKNPEKLRRRAMAKAAERQDPYVRGVGLAPIAGGGVLTGAADVAAMRAEKAAAAKVRQETEAFRRMNDRTSGRRGPVPPTFREPPEFTALPSFPVNRPLTQRDAIRENIQRRYGMSDPRTPVGFDDAVMSQVPASSPPPRVKPAKMGKSSTTSKVDRKALTAAEVARRQFVSSIAPVATPDDIARSNEANRRQRLDKKLERARSSRTSIGQRVGAAVGGFVSADSNKKAASAIGGVASGGLKAVGGGLKSAGASLLSPFVAMGGMLKALLVPIAVLSAKFALIGIAVAGVAALFVTAAKRAGILDTVVSGIRDTFSGVYAWASKAFSVVFQAAKMGEIGDVLSYVFAEAKVAFFSLLQAMLTTAPQAISMLAKLFVALGETLVEVFLNLGGLIINAITGVGKGFSEMFADIGSEKGLTGEGSFLDTQRKKAVQDRDMQAERIGMKAQDKENKANAKLSREQAIAAAAEARNTEIADREERDKAEAAEKERRNDLSISGVSSIAFGMDSGKLAENQKLVGDRVKSLMEENVAMVQAAMGNKNYLDVVNGVSSAMITASQSASSLNEALKMSDVLSERITSARSATFSAFDGGSAEQEKLAAIRAIFDADQKNLQVRREAVSLERAGLDAGLQGNALFEERQKTLALAVEASGAASATARKNFEKLNEALRAEAVAKFAETISSLGSEIERLALGADAAERLSLERQGLNEAEIKAIEGLKKRKAALEDRAAEDEKRKSRASEIIESIKTPQQRYAESQREILDLQKAGLLSAQEAGDALGKASVAFMEATQPNVGMTGFKANKSGSAEALEARRAALVQLRNMQAQARANVVAQANAQLAQAAQTIDKAKEAEFKRRSLQGLADIVSAIKNTPPQMVVLP